MSDDDRRSASLPPRSVRRRSSRSPFVRLTELLADIKPGKPPINLSVGEPQHPIPPFVGPVLAGASRRLRPLSGQQGHRALPPGRRRLARPPLQAAARRSIPRPKCSCSTARARACSSARIAAKRWVAAARRQARDPDPQSVLRRLFGRRASPPTASRSICRPRAATGFLPDLDALDDELLARTVAFYLASPSNPQGAVAERAYLDAAGRAGAPLRLPGVRRRMLLRDLSARHAAARHAGSAGPRLRQRRRVPLAVEALQPARPARRLCRRRPPLPRAATSSCATSPRRRCRCRRRRSRSRPTATRRMSRRTASSTSPSSISPTRSSATATATSARPAASSSGSTCRRRAAAKR